MLVYLALIAFWEHWQGRTRNKTQIILKYSSIDHLRICLSVSLAAPCPMNQGRQPGSHSPRSKKELQRLIGQIHFSGSSFPTLQGKSSLSPVVRFLASIASTWSSGIPWSYIYCSRCQWTRRSTSEENRSIGIGKGGRDERASWRGEQRIELNT